MKKILLLLLSFNKVYCQNIPSYYKKTTVFLSTISETGEIKVAGTGFFIIIIDSNNAFGYLATAKHVISNPINKSFYPSIQIRYNKKNQIFSNINIDLKSSGNTQNVFVHDDPSVDLAVIPLLLDPANSDIMYSNLGEFFKSERDFDTSYVKEGTNLFYAGMFSPYLGYKKNFPITRFGKVSLMPDEKIIFDTTELKAKLFLVETTTFGGNSGSPVFAYGSDYKIDSHDSTDPVNTKEQNHVPIYLVGIIKGYYGENLPVQFNKTSTMTPTYTSNIGITGIIPSYLLYEILLSKTLKSIRNSVNNIKNK